MIRRQFLRSTTNGLLASLLPNAPELAPPQTVPSPAVFDVRQFGAAGDGVTVDSPAINRAIEAAAAAGGGSVVFPAGTYSCYTIRLKSNISLRLEAGAVLLAASVPDEGTPNGGYDPAGPAQPWETYQDFGHAHWANSLIYGEDLRNVSIYGPGLIWGRGLSRGEPDELPRAESPGVGNKAIALKQCIGVVLRDFSVLMGGHFAVLLTGTDNVVVEGLTIDTNRDGIDIDCCRNVRLSNCVVNSPWDDAICPKSSYALGYPRATENVTISNCYVTGMYEFGTLLSGKMVRHTYSEIRKAVGRIKCGTESNGGFKSIVVTNCILEGCRGFALETVDGAQIEDVAVSNLTLRGVIHSPLFLRLGRRMRGPVGAPPGALRRISFSNIVSSNAVAAYPSIIAGTEGLSIEDVNFDNLYLHQEGGAAPAWASRRPPENSNGYPEADMFGPLPATGFFLRHARNVQFSNIEIATQAPDPRAAIWADDLNGLDIFRMRAPQPAPAFSLHRTRAFRVFGSRTIPDRTLATADEITF